MYRLECDEASFGRRDDRLLMTLCVSMASPASEKSYGRDVLIAGVVGASSAPGRSQIVTLWLVPDAQALNTASLIDGVSSESVFCESTSDANLSRFFGENMVGASELSAGVSSGLTD